ncbi:MAG: hypothetical protein ACJ768_02140 [Gaiellaceae bacterium]
MTESPRPTGDRLEELLARAQAARAARDSAEEAWQAAREELRAHTESAQLDAGRREEVARVLGDDRPHRRHRWGPAPS